jgi:hypothetical protein
MYEHRSQPLVGRRSFLRRVGRHALIAVAIILGSLAVGVAGYRETEGLEWIDALLNASMILGGMGPVNSLHSAPGKLFASLYALHTGIILVLTTGTLFAPLPAPLSS